MEESRRGRDLSGGTRIPPAAQVCSPEERATMPGMLMNAKMGLLRSTKGDCHQLGGLMTVDRRIALRKRDRIGRGQSQSREHKAASQSGTCSYTTV
jgi:hypothetical protein